MQTPCKAISPRTNPPTKKRIAMFRPLLANKRGRCPLFVSTRVRERAQPGRKNLDSGKPGPRSAGTGQGLSRPPPWAPAPSVTRTDAASRDAATRGREDARLQTALVEGELSIHGSDERAASWEFKFSFPPRSRLQGPQRLFSKIPSPQLRQPAGRPLIDEDPVSPAAASFGA